MQLFNKTIAKTLLGGMLSIAPMANASAQKAAIGVAGNVQSITIATKVNKNLNGLAKDTLNLSNKFVSNKSICKTCSIDDLVLAPDVPPIGVKNLKETVTTRYYELSNKVFSAITRDREDIFDTLNIKKIIMQVPKLKSGESLKFNDHILKCGFKMQLKPYSTIEKNGDKTVSTTIRALKNQEERYLTFTEIKHPDKTSETASTVYKYIDGESGSTEHGVAVAKIYDANGKYQGEYYRQITEDGGQRKGIDITQEEYINGKKALLEDFDGLYDKSAKEFEVKTNATSKQSKIVMESNNEQIAKEKQIQQATKLESVKNELKSKIDFKDQQISYNVDLIKSLEETRQSYLTMINMQTDYTLRETLMMPVNELNSKIVELNQYINRLTGEQNQLVEQLESL